MKNFIREINEFYNNSISFSDCDSLYIEKKYWDVLDQANSVGKILCQGKNDYKKEASFTIYSLLPK